MSLSGVSMSGLRWTAPVQSIPPSRSCNVPFQPAVPVPHPNTMSSIWASVLLRDCKTLLCTGHFFSPQTSTWTIDRLRDMSVETHSLDAQRTTGGVIHRQKNIWMFFLTPIGLQGDCATLEWNCFAEKGVFYSTEDYNEHTGRLPERYLGSERPRLEWCNV